MATITHPPLWKLPPSTTSSIININGIHTHALEAGAGESVLLLHGLGASSYSWRHTIEPLSRHCRVIAIDLPGYGRSDQPENFSYSPEGYRDFILELLMTLKIDKIHLVGNSLGGLIALLVAIEKPKFISTLSLLGAPVYQENKPKLLWPLRWPVIGTILEHLSGGFIVFWAARQTFIDKSLVTEELLREYSISTLTPRGRHAVAEFIRNAVPKNAHELTARYQTMTTPTQFIRGDQDNLVHLNSAQRFCQEVPGAILHQIPHCGHAPQEEHPEIVNPLLANFIKNRPIKNSSNPQNQPNAFV